MFKASPESRLSLACLGLALFAAYLVTHPYRGVYGDALIYVTRAWATAPIVQGDMLFAHEHQTGLTLYGALLRGWMNVAPVAEAARGLALVGVGVWFAGLLAVAFAMARAARLPASCALAMAALVAIAPLGYSAGSSFMAGEFLAVPRPFAEGFVWIALALMLAGRRLAGALVLIIAAAFHPLMALAGAGVAFIWAASSEWRLWLLAGAGACAALLAAALGAPAAGGLLATFDAEWLALLRARTSYLFLTQAPVSFWVDLLLRGAILLVAARQSEGRLRAFLRAILVASAGGVAVSLLFADLWPSILITQLQPWRVLFIPAVLAPAAIVLIAADPRNRLVPPLFACAYMTRDAALISVFFSLGALAFHMRPALAGPRPARVEALLWITAAAAWVSFDLLHVAALAGVFERAPQGAFQWIYLWTLRPFSLPLAVLCLLLAFRGPALRPWLAVTAAVVAGLCAVLRFDDRTPVDVAIETRQASAWAQLLPQGEGPVLWLGVGKEPWYWLGRPNWAAPVQASSIVFSRDLAMAWGARARFLIDEKIFPEEVWTNRAAPGPGALPSQAVATVCARPDGPSAIIAPLRAGEPSPEDALRVRAPARMFHLRAGDDIRFEEIDSYAVWSCRRKTGD